MTLSRKERSAMVRTSIWVDVYSDMDEDLALLGRLGDFALWDLGVRYNEERRGCVCNGNKT
jgi:hypothetical protein